jgi:hypothetical protein
LQLNLKRPIRDSLVAQMFFYGFKPDTGLTILEASYQLYGELFEASTKGFKMYDGKRGKEILVLIEQHFTTADNPMVSINLCKKTVKVSKK